MNLRIIPIEQIVEDSGQVRKALDDAALSGLADSIRQHGLLNPITVVPLEGVEGYRIVTGERRWRAAQRANLYEIPCLVRPAEPVDRTAEQLIENLQREDLAPLDKANAVKRIKEAVGGTNREVAQRLGLSERTVGYLLDLLDLPESIAEQIVSSPNRPADGQVTEKHGRFLRQLNEQPDVQAGLVDKIRKERLSSDDTGKVVRALRTNPDLAEAILESEIGTLPSLLGRPADEPFSVGKALCQVVDGIAPRLSDFTIQQVSAADLPAVEASLETARRAIDAKLAEVRAARRDA